MKTPPIPPIRSADSNFKLPPGAWIGWGAIALLLAATMDRLMDHPGFAAGTIGAMIFAPGVGAWMGGRAGAKAERARAQGFFAVLGLGAAIQLGGAFLPGRSAAVAGAEANGPRATRQATVPPGAIAFDVRQIFDFSGVTTTAQLAEHRAIAAKAQAANREMIENLRLAKEATAATSTKTDRPNDGAQKWTTTQQLGEAEERLFTAVMGQFELLEDNWGHWHASGSRVTFNDPEVAKRYNAGLATIREIGAEAKAIQGQLSPREESKQ